MNITKQIANPVIPLDFPHIHSIALGLPHSLVVECTTRLRWTTKRKRLLWHVNKFAEVILPWWSIHSIHCQHLWKYVIATNPRHCLEFTILVHSFQKGRPRCGNSGGSFGRDAKPQSTSVFQQVNHFHRTIPTLVRPTGAYLMLISDNISTSSFARLLKNGRVTMVLIAKSTVSSLTSKWKFLAPFWSSITKVGTRSSKYVATAALGSSKALLAALVRFRKK